LLCTTRWGRDFLRANGVYEIVRATHENETVDKISEHIERLVNLLKGDEAPEDVDEHYDEGLSVRAPNSNDESDDDSRIEEV